VTTILITSNNHYKNGEIQFANFKLANIFRIQLFSNKDYCSYVHNIVFSKLRKKLSYISHCITVVLVMKHLSIVW